MNADWSTLRAQYQKEKDCRFSFGYVAVGKSFFIFTRFSDFNFKQCGVHFAQLVYRTSKKRIK